MEGKSPHHQSRKNEVHNPNGPPCLPEEIIFEEILARLPVKPLSKFRCVSKLWCSLIGSRSFMKAHLRNSIIFSHHRIVLNSMHGLGHCSLPSLFNEPFTDSIDYTAARGINAQRAEMIYLVGCCNGLVCILLDLTTFILWNPTTKKSRNLPHFNNDKPMHGPIMKYGFGFDELKDDFKVFGSLHLYATDGTCHTIGKVYSLRSNSWKAVEYSVSSFHGAGVYVNGKLHWQKHDKCVIVSFDLNSHVSGVVDLPSSYSYSSDVRFLSILRVHKGCLIAHALQIENPNTHLHIWVMKEYGVKESWDKVTSVLYFNDPRGYSFAIAPNGDVLLNYGPSFAIYNPKSNVLRLSNALNYTSFLESGIYIESLASVDSEST
ncbi:hypothetical protein ACS0TY_004382 [Phlomoides rotata]